MSDKLSTLFKKCAQEIEYVNVNDWVSYAFVQEGTHLYIYFQGSSEKKDWQANFDFWPVFFKRRPYKNMAFSYKVHRGFLTAWKEVEDIIIEKIKDPAWTDITVIGYSHGGALCQFAVECVWFYRPDLREGHMRGYAFEAPRIFAQWRFPKQLRERWKDLYIIRDGSDLVTHVPPVLFGYRHIGKIIKIKGDPSLVTEKWIPTCIKYHYPQVVYDGLLKMEAGEQKE